MRVVCADCGKFMGEVELTGKLRKGYAALSVYILCANCHYPPEDFIKRTVGDDDAVEKLMGMFGMGGGNYGRV